MLGTSTAGNAIFDFDIGYTFNLGAVTAVGTINYQSATALTGARTSFCTTRVFTAAQAGTYTFGFAVRNSGSNALNLNDWMSVTGVAF